MRRLEHFPNLVTMFFTRAAEKGDAPFLIFHGDADGVVPLGQSKLLFDALRHAKVEAELIVVKGAGHGGDGFGAAENREALEKFLDKHLKNKK